jgi:hypothetical protein
MKSAGSLYDERTLPEVKLLVANQLLRLVDSVYHRDGDRNDIKASGKDGQWKPIVGHVAKLDIRWDAEKNRYTFKDGSHLPDPITKLYSRHSWKLPGLMVEATLTFERKDARFVNVSLAWSGKIDADSPPAVVNVFAAKNKAKALVKLGPIVSLGANGSSSQATTIELAEGEEIQATLMLGKTEKLSPVYRP